MFRLSNMHPKHIVSRFSTLIPTKIENEGSIEFWLDKNPLPLEVQESKEALGQLMIFIEESMKSYALTGSEIMIMNTVLFQCIFILKPEKIQIYISQNLPLCFDTVAQFLLKNNAFSALLVLCRNNCKHTISSSYLKDSYPISDLVNFIQLCSDFEIVAKSCSNYIIEKSPENLLKLFCSPNLLIGQAIPISQYFDDVKGLQPKTRSRSKITFLEYWIYDKKFIDFQVHQFLIRLYIESLREIIDGTPTPIKYIAISNEKEPLRSLRTGLKRILVYSNQYHALSFLHKIDSRFVEERLIVMAKSDNTKGCIDLMDESGVDVDVIIEFCDYREKEKNPI